MKKLMMARAAVVLSQGSALANTARDYVQDGLVAQWDGIENDGRGTRTDSPTVWKDLVGSSDVTIPSWVSVTSDKTGFLSAGSTETRTYPELASIPGLTNNSVTIEVVAKCVRWTTSSDYLKLQYLAYSPWGQFGYRTSKDNGLFINFSGTVRNNESTGVDVKTINTLASCFNQATSPFQGELFSNGTKLKVATSGDSVSLPTVWRFFCAARTDIEIYAMRVYNRRLTDVELSANAAIDKARFIDKDYVIWDSELTNVERNGADFVWKVPYGMTLPVTARIVTGFKPDLSDGVVHTLDTVSDQSEVTSHFSFVRGDATYWRAEAVDADGKTCTLGVRTMPEAPLVVDSCSYEDDGLVAQWDGIENDGRGTRTDSPTVWKDLVGSSDVTIPSWVSVTSDKTGFLSTGLSAGSTETRTYPELASIPGLTNNSVTIEVVAKRVRWTNSGNYEVLQFLANSPWGQFGYRNNTDYGLFINSNGRICNNSSTGVNVKTINTLAGLFTKGSSNNDLFANATKLSVLDHVPIELPTVWRFFCATRTDIEIYAMRVYNRRLTDWELCANAAVDRYRFLDDKLAVVPLLMQFDGPGASARKELSFWTIPGETFAYRADRLVPQGTRQSVCLGWTLYVEAGADSWTEQTHGETCDFSYLPDGRRYRLVWHTATAADVADGYVVRDYLESSGQQTLNTGYQPKSSTKIALDLSLHGTFRTGFGGSLFSSAQSAEHLQLGCNFGGSANEGRILYWWTCYSNAGGGPVKKLTIDSGVTLSSRNLFSFDMAAGRGSYGSSEITGLSSRTAGQSQEEPVYLFGSPTKPFGAYPNMRVYNATFSDGDVPRFDGVPAVSLETGKCGLYDCVSGQLFTNCVADATADFAVGGVSPCIYVEGEPSRLGEPTIPYGCAEIADGTSFALSETNLVVSEGHELRVRSIERYELDSTSGQWSYVGRTRGSSVTATFDGVPTKYVLKWGARPGLILIFE